MKNKVKITIEFDGYYEIENGDEPKVRMMFRPATIEETKVMVEMINNVIISHQNNLLMPTTD